ncbi:MAG: site-specific DNA-methyltransferase [Candidatus Eisenbacteria sp.]|nr:site-specific DNA-methyltransferase [Candidatus Eisenbacteria bacterium]
MNRIIFGDNLPILREMPDASVDLIYVDPPFNTGRRQERLRMKTIQDESGGDRTGFQGKRYRTVKLGKSGYADAYDDYMEFLGPRLAEAHRILCPTGSLFLHLDFREVHYAKVFLDDVFGRDCFMSEIIWAYDYGARSKSKWSAKHDNILWYVRDAHNYTFEFDEMDRIPYMAPGLVGKEKAARGKTPTDVWWHTIVSPNSKEKTGYATQKPLAVLERIVKVHSKRGDLLMDFFAGSGTLGEAAARHGRHFLLIDSNPDAIRVIIKRLGKLSPELVNCDEVIETDPHSPAPLHQDEANSSQTELSI